MAGQQNNISMEEFRRFHSIDCELYTILVLTLKRDPFESMQVMAFWLWLETMGFKDFVKKVHSSSNSLISELVDESIICLNSIANNQSTAQNSDICFLQSFTGYEISLGFLRENMVNATHGMNKIVNEVCLGKFHDIMKEAIDTNAKQTRASFSSSSSSSLQHNLNYPIPFHLQNNGIVSHVQDFFVVPPTERTLFVTFSKGFPVFEWEVREFLTRNYGDCIESFNMQRNDDHHQALYAIVLFNSPNPVQMILNGTDKAKFIINGKHVWARKFIPRVPKT